MWLQVRQENQLKQKELPTLSWKLKSSGFNFLTVADFLRALHWPSLTLPPLASQLDNSEEKTCFVPVYFSGSKSWSIGRVLRC